MVNGGNIILKSNFWLRVCLPILASLQLHADLTEKKKLLFYFNKIDVGGAVDVFIQPADRNEQATIYADSDIMDNISLIVRDRTLFIEANNTFDLTRRLPFLKLSAKRTFPVEILVNADKLEEIRLSGRSNVTLSDAHSRRLAIFANGTGRFHLANSAIDHLAIRQDGNGPIILNSKEVSSLELIIIGDGVIYAQGLPVDRAKIVHRGNSNIEINPIKFLDSRIFGQGNILLHSRPKNIVVSQKGTGKVVDVIPDNPQLYDLNTTLPSTTGQPNNR
jgi:hypothetical protein